MTQIYFVRHAESDASVHDDMNRPLTEKGLRDLSLVTKYLEDKNISVIFSSPYRRAYDTVSDFAKRNDLEIIRMDHFRERAMADTWIDNYTAYSQRQWKDFDYKIASGENLREVQSRNVEALFTLLSSYPDQSIVIGTHGTALSTIINYFDPSFQYESFAKIVGLTPWIVHFTFDGRNCVSIEDIDLFS